MHNLSVTQALSIWSQLEQALHGTNKYGGFTAEIYIYALMPFEPTVARSSSDITQSEGMIGDIAREAYDQANVSLYNILTHFAKERSTHIEVEGRELGEWLKTARYQHRVHVHLPPGNEE